MDNRSMKTNKTALPQINFHHLRSFWAVAKEGGLNRAAEAGRLSPSALSIQISTLEASLGQPLFERRGRRLVLTEAGRTALEHAERIFAAGRDLEDWFQGGAGGARRALRVGALGTLSKNLQFDFVWPLLREGADAVTVEQGSQDELLLGLKEHRLDVVLTSLPAGAGDAPALRQAVLGEMPVYLVGRPPFRIPRLPFPRWLDGLPLFLPSRRSSVRLEFDTLVARAGVRPQVRAEVDDMALLRLLALSGSGLALVPKIVVEGEVTAGEDLRIERVPGLAERFYAITGARQREDARIEPLITSLRRQLEAAERRGSRRARRL
jgi:LysR family transcriptional regulator, transcriptional activator of nhaA